MQRRKFSRSGNEIRQWGSREPVCFLRENARSPRAGANGWCARTRTQIPSACGIRSMNRLMEFPLYVDTRELQTRESAPVGNRVSEFRNAARTRRLLKNTTVNSASHRLQQLDGRGPVAYDASVRNGLCRKRTHQLVGSASGKHRQLVRGTLLADGDGREHKAWV